MQNSSILTLQVKKELFQLHSKIIVDPSYLNVTVILMDFTIMQKTLIFRAWFPFFFILQRERELSNSQYNLRRNSISAWIIYNIVNMSCMYRFLHMWRPNMEKKLSLPYTSIVSGISGSLWSKLPFHVLIIYILTKFTSWNIFLKKRFPDEVFTHQLPHTQGLQLNSSENNDNEIALVDLFSL